MGTREFQALQCALTRHETACESKVKTTATTQAVSRKSALVCVTFWNSFKLTWMLTARQEPLEGGIDGSDSSFGTNV